MEEPNVHARDYSGLFRVGLAGTMRQVFAMLVEVVTGGLLARVVIIVVT